MLPHLQIIIINFHSSHTWNFLSKHCETPSATEHPHPYMMWLYILPVAEVAVSMPFLHLSLQGTLGIAGERALCAPARLLDNHSVEARVHLLARWWGPRPSHSCLSPAQTSPCEDGFSGAWQRRLTAKVIKATAFNHYPN